ncbi:MAG: hypothetical protein ACJAT7_001903 [Psychromonas sp.]
MGTTTHACGKKPSSKFFLGLGRYAIKLRSPAPLVKVDYVIVGSLLLAWFSLSRQALYSPSKGITIGSDSHKEYHLGHQIKEIKNELRFLGFESF